MNPVTCIDLLRHGDVQGGRRFRGHTDDPLSEDGWAQMWRAVHAMAYESLKPGRIISSPLRRCADFAHVLSQRYAIPCELERRLMEMHFGTWEGKSAAELMASDARQLANFWQNPAVHTPPGGEPLAVFGRRVLSAWQDILASHAGKNLLIITHGGVIRSLLCHVLQRPVKDLLAFEVEHACRLRIRVDSHSGQARVESPDGGSLL